MRTYRMSQKRLLLLGVVILSCGPARLAELDSPDRQSADRHNPDASDATAEESTEGAAGLFQDANSGTASPENLDTVPVWDMPAHLTLDEYEILDLPLVVTNRGNKRVRVSCSRLPPGAQLDLATRRIRFTPDFIQGGRTERIECSAFAGKHTSAVSIPLEVRDSIRPPVPVITQVETESGFERQTVIQTTDKWLDAPAYSGREFSAIVTVPSVALDSIPVRIVLHGYGSEPGSQGSTREIRIYPHDPYRTYWWGYAEGLPERLTGVVADFTQRRVLHLLAWVLDTVPGADPERVYVVGASMGGAGALSMGLRHARHFAYVESVIGQTVARNHRPTRVAQLATHWGHPQDDLPGPTRFESVWNAQDMVSVLNSDWGARQQYVFTYHGKDDPIIHFGAVVQASPVVGLSWYRAIQSLKTGHYAVWDEGGHGIPDPVMGAGWYENNWDRIHHPVTFLRRDLPFPAFTNSTADGTPGQSGKGTLAFDVESGFAADVSVPGDTGWNGDITGTFNRYLRWDSNSIVDTAQVFSIKIWAVNGTGEASPVSGYPTKGDMYAGPIPVSVDVTPRRTQRFRCHSGEQVAWTFGVTSGTAVCSTDNVPTIVQLPVTHEQTTLRIVRL
ncbi:MAG: alpha/beta hydrolase-fold protein [Myxococcota bacterium]|nr:alpha/beta hydrolase-fold protein [Myxococcota bacterium]